MKTLRIITYVILFSVGGIILWYFGHHHPEEEIIKNDLKSVSDVRPQIILNDTPSESSSTVGTTTKVPQEAGKENSEERHTDPNDGTSSIELGKETPLSDEEAAAFEGFLIAESEYIAEQEVFKEALISGDTDTLEAATASLRKARLNRNEALRNLADTSEEASKLLAEIEVQEAEVKKEAARIIAEIESEEFEPKSKHVPELGFDKEEFRELFNALPLKEQRILLERFPSLKHLLQED